MACIIDEIINELNDEVSYGENAVTYYIGTGNATIYKSEHIPNMINKLSSIKNYGIVNKSNSNANSNVNSEGSRYQLQGKFDASSDQIKAIDMAVEMIKAKNKGIANNIMIVQGLGGTGKSTAIGRAIEIAHAENEDIRFVGAAFTHTAKDVLKDMTKTMDKEITTDINTVSSLFGDLIPFKAATYRDSYGEIKTYKPERTDKYNMPDRFVYPGENKYMFNIKKDPQYDGIYRDKVVIVIDEVSMLSKDAIVSLISINQEGLENGTTKIIFMGDYHQLSPVDVKKDDARIAGPLVKGAVPAAISLVVGINPFNPNIRSEKSAYDVFSGIKNITEIKQQQRQNENSTLYKFILDKASQVEDAFGIEDKYRIGERLPSGPIVNDGNLEIFNTSGRAQFNRAAVESFKNDMSGTKFIAFNNKTVAMFTDVVRNGLFGQESVNNHMIAGKDQAITYSTLYTTEGRAVEGFTNGTQLKIVSNKPYVKKPKQDKVSLGEGLKFTHGIETYALQANYKDGIDLIEIVYESTVDGKQQLFEIIYPKNLFKDMYDEMRNGGSDIKVDALYLKAIKKYVDISPMFKYQEKETHEAFRKRYYGATLNDENVFSKFTEMEMSSLDALIPVGYAYALTTYKAQGQTIRNVFYDNGISISTSADKTTRDISVASSAYTGLSRTKDKLFILDNAREYSGVNLVNGSNIKSQTQTTSNTGKAITKMNNIEVGDSIDLQIINPEKSLNGYNVDRIKETENGYEMVLLQPVAKNGIRYKVSVKFDKEGNGTGAIGVFDKNGNLDKSEKELYSSTVNRVGTTKKEVLVSPGSEYKLDETGKYYKELRGNALNAKLRDDLKVKIVYNTKLQTWSMNEASSGFGITEAKDNRRELLQAIKELDDDKINLLNDKNKLAKRISIIRESEKLPLSERKKFRNEQTVDQEIHNDIISEMNQKDDTIQDIELNEISEQFIKDFEECLK